MSHFSSSGKHHPDAISVPEFGAISVDVSVAGTVLEQDAPATLGGYSFLFWDTGRRITTKRKVRWTFNHPEDWSNWTAVAWYGTVIGGRPVPQASATAYSVGSSTLVPTPIDGPGSSFVNGPGGSPVAWPWNGDDHVARTEWGAATLQAKSQLQASSVSPIVKFSSWILLVAGGDGTGFFSETDEDIDTSSGGSGVTGVVASGSDEYTVAMGAGADLLAGYVTPAATGPGPWLDKIREILENEVFGPIKYIDKGDPSPEDLIRMKILSESLDMLKGGRPSAADAFAGLVEAARGMSSQELKRAIMSTQTTLKRGEAAVKYMETLAAKQKTAPVKAAPAKTAKAPAKTPAKAPAKTRKPTK